MPRTTERAHNPTQGAMSLKGKSRASKSMFMNPLMMDMASFRLRTGGRPFPPAVNLRRAWKRCRLYADKP